MLIVYSIGVGVVPYFLDGRSEGRWSPGADRLLELRGPVEAAELRAVLRGRDPRTDAFLPALRRKRRRAGWDLIFGAPKSLSLLGATATGGWEAAYGAHRAAVEGVLGELEARLGVSSGAPAEGLVAACFDHRTNASGEPHLHTHVLVANLTRGPNGWAAASGTDWYVGRKAFGALYQLALRHELSARGWDLEWRLRADGMADLVDVPRSAVRAASWQGRVAAAEGRFEARRQAGPRAWEAGVAAAGMSAQAGPRSTGGPLPPAPDQLRRFVTARLAGRRSDFSRSDVLVALAATRAGGVSVPDAVAWADRFCANSIRVDSATCNSRWTTDTARRADEDLWSQLAALAAERDQRYETVTVLASPPGRTDFLAQAEFLHQCCQKWAETGEQAAVAAFDEASAMRWAVLTGLPPYRNGDKVGVIVVDRADRRTAADLSRLAQAASRNHGRLVLVEGGTLPRLSNPASHAFQGFGDEHGRWRCPTHKPWSALAPGTVDAGHGTVGRAAVEGLLARWQQERRAGRPPLLVGLGLEEVQGLNQAAGALARGTWRTSGGAYVPIEGDRVVVLRAREGLPPAGTMGQVTEASGRVAVRWEDAGVGIVGKEALPAVGAGWAVTPALAARIRRPVMLLGPESAAPRLRGLVRASVPQEGRPLDRGLRRSPSRSL